MTASTCSGIAMTEPRHLPHAVDMERSILSSMLQEPEPYLDRAAALFLSISLNKCRHKERTVIILKCRREKPKDPPRRNRESQKQKDRIMKITLTKNTPSSSVKVRSISFNFTNGTFKDHDCRQCEFKLSSGEMEARMKSLEGQGWERK
jgi:hypothetical protein